MPQAISAERIRSGSQAAAGRRDGRCPPQAAMTVPGLYRRER